MRSSLFCNVTQLRLLVSYRRFGTTKPSHIQGSSKKNIRNTSAQQMGPTDCPETSVATNLRNVHPRIAKTSFTLRRKPDITHLRRCSQLLKSHQTHQLQKYNRNDVQSYSTLTYISRHFAREHRQKLSRLQVY